MSKIKNVIIILSVMLVIIVIVLAILLTNSNNSGESGQQVISEDEGLEAYETEIDTDLALVTNRTSFYTVKECVGKYYSYYSVIFNAGNYYYTDDEEIISQAELDNSQILYNILDTEYVTSKSITVDNIKTNLKEIGQVTATITDMYFSRKTENVEVYVVEGKLKESITSEGEDFKIILKLDLINRTFSVMPQEYVEEMYSDLEIGSKIDKNITDSIEKNDNNEFSYKTVTDEEYIKDLFAQLKNELLYDAESAYEHLEEEYRETKFESLNEFADYVANRQEQYTAMTLTQYQVTEEEGYTQYVLVDQDDKYYILNVTAVMKYATILDTYTVDLPQFVERYNSVVDAQKAGLNLQKIVDAINNQDYEYVYNKLDETFRANNFPTVENLEEYIQNNLYVSVDVEFSNYNSSGGLHMYDATFTNKEDETSGQIEKTFIVKLLDGTDFVMSFNV